MKRGRVERDERKMKHAVVVVVKVFYFLFFIFFEEGLLHSLASSVWPEVQVQTKAPPFPSSHSCLKSFDQAQLMEKWCNKQQHCVLPEGSR